MRSPVAEPQHDKMSVFTGSWYLDSGPPKKSTVPYLRANQSTRSANAQNQLKL